MKANSITKSAPFFGTIITVAVLICTTADSSAQMPNDPRYRKAGPAAPAAAARPAAPMVNRPAPMVNRPAPVVNRPAPVVSHPAPVVNRPAPVVNRPAPVVSHPAPVVSRPAPVVNRPAPVVSHPAPVVSRPAPVVSHPAPVVSHPASPIHTGTASTPSNGIRPNPLSNAPIHTGASSVATGGMIVKTPGSPIHSGYPVASGNSVHGGTQGGTVRPAAPAFSGTGVTAGGTILRGPRTIVDSWPGKPGTKTPGTTKGNGYPAAPTFTGTNKTPGGSIVTIGKGNPLFQGGGIRPSGPAFSGNRTFPAGSNVTVNRITNINRTTVNEVRGGRLLPYWGGRREFVPVFVGGVQEENPVTTLINGVVTAFVPAQQEQVEQVEVAAPVEQVQVVAPVVVNTLSSRSSSVRPVRQAAPVAVQAAADAPTPYVIAISRTGNAYFFVWNGNTWMSTQAPDNAPVLHGSDWTNSEGIPQTPYTATQAYTPFALPYAVLYDYSEQSGSAFGTPEALAPAPYQVEGNGYQVTGDGIIVSI